MPLASSISAAFLAVCCVLVVAVEIASASGSFVNRASVSAFVSSDIRTSLSMLTPYDQEYTMLYKGAYWVNCDELPSNVLRFSCAAPLDRNDCRAEISFQKRPDLGAAKRRQLQAPVGWQVRGDVWIE